MKFLGDLQRFMMQHKNELNAVPMKKYMKDHFDFLGIKSPERKTFIREFLKENGLPSREHYENIAIGLWSLPYRDFQYIGMELVEKMLKKTVPEDIYAIEYMLEYKQWWDTVDFISTHLVAKLFKEHPQVRETYFYKWNNSQDLWLNRAAILYQLKYKKETDTNNLSLSILSHCKSKEFFHQKAIGWALREYAKTDSKWVVNFVKDHDELAPLSKREAIKHIKVDVF